MAETLAGMGSSMKKVAQKCMGPLEVDRAMIAQLVKADRAVAMS